MSKDKRVSQNPSQGRDSPREEPKNSRTTIDEASKTTLQGAVTSDASSVDSMWEKLVLYYLSRLKGLCDWRGKDAAVKPTTSDHSVHSHSHTSSGSSDHLEAKVIKEVTYEALDKFRHKEKPHRVRDDEGTYIAAGYEEGKQQAAKIVTRSLRYGVLTGILEKKGNMYRVRSQYLRKSNQKHECPKNCKGRRGKKLAKPRIRKTRTQVKAKPRNTKSACSKLKSKGNRNKNTCSPSCIKSSKRHDNSPSPVRKRNDFYTCSSSASPRRFTRSIPVKRRKRSVRSSTLNAAKSRQSSLSSRGSFKRKRRTGSDVTFKPRESHSRSRTSKSSSRGRTVARAKRTRPKIQEPSKLQPPVKKPRNKSQSKSPSSTDSGESIVDCKKPNTFRMPGERRASSVLSSMSNLSMCTECKKKSDASGSSNSNTSTKSLNSDSSKKSVTL